METDLAELHQESGVERDDHDPDNTSVESQPDVDLNTSNELYDGIAGDENALLGTSFVSGGELYDDMVETLEKNKEGGSQGSKAESDNSIGSGAGQFGDTTYMNVKIETFLSDQNGSPTTNNTSAMSINHILQKRCAVYVGNLTWWTTHDDIKNAIRSLGVSDVMDVKIFECRANGQSKGYCLVTFASDSSVKSVLELMEKTEIHGRNPVVKPDTKMSCNYFESLSKTRPPPSNNATPLHQGTDHNRIINVSTSTGGFSANRYISRTPSHYSGRFNGNRTLGSNSRFWTPYSYTNGNNRFTPRVPGAYVPHRAPPPCNFPPTTIPPPFDDWRYNGSNVPHRVHYNPAFLNRLPVLINDLEFGPPPTVDLAGSFQQTSIPQCPQQGGSPPGVENHSPDKPSVACSITTTAPITPLMSTDTGIQSRPLEILPLMDESKSGSKSKLDADDLLERNESICSQAIQRAVNDTRSGEYASAIETLVTAISLIRGSKVAKDKRCQVLICSLQDTLEGIEHRSYGRQKISVLDYSKDKGYRRSRSPVLRDSRHHYERDLRESRPYSNTEKERCRQRTWEERDRGYATEVERDRDSKVKLSRSDSIKEYRR